MSKKLQQFWILKIDSRTIRESNYKISLDLENARKNNEVVSIADSQMVRSIHRITGSIYTQSRVNELLSEIKSVKRRSNTKDNRSRVSKLNSELEKLLFIPEIISVLFSHKKHSSKLIRDGFVLNNTKYVPFMASSGMIRRNTMLFVQKDYFDELKNVFENGRDYDMELVPAKYGVYYSLVSSSSIAVSFPNICVVPDRIIKYVKRVDYGSITDDESEPIMEEKDVELEFNSFDGQGLVSPRMAKIWSSDLELDYVPSAFLVRGSFIKGLCVVFDFHKFAKENNIQSITDVYGNEMRVKDVDAIISESQFKLWNGYSSVEEYIDFCEKNNMGWGISRYTPKEDKDHAFSSYQFIQSLNLDKQGVEDICKPTIDWIESVVGGDVYSTILYLMGTDPPEWDTHWFKRLDNVNKGILLENKLIHDSYILRLLNKSIEKKKKDACMGRLVFPGNYSFMISDPYAQACHIMGLPFSPLLENGECYSHYWNNKTKSEKVALVRSPIVHYSEVDVLKLSRTEEQKKWYKYIQSGIIFPPYGEGMDCAILGGSD